MIITQTERTRLQDAFLLRHKGDLDLNGPMIQLAPFAEPLALLDAWYGTICAIDNQLIQEINSINLQNYRFVRN